MKPCPFCEAEISDTAQKCRHCGEWITHAAGDSGVPRVVPAGVPIRVAPTNLTVRVEPEEPLTFAILTLVFYLFVYPIGLLLNVVGLITGPRRGCFVSMVMVFVALPVVVIALLAAAGIDVLQGISDAFGSLF